MVINGFAELGRRLNNLLFGAPVVFEIEWDDSPVEHTLHLQWAECPTCNGKGTHVNPSIDSHGIVQAEFDDDPDFEEEYRSGMYDETCYECEGRKQVVEIDRKRTDPEALAEAEKAFEEEASYRSECESERRMGA